MSIIAEKDMSATTDLNDLIARGGTADKKLGVLVGHNLGNNTLLVKVPMHEFFEISEVANERGLSNRADLGGQEIAQRNLDTKHAQKLAVYLIKGLANAVANRYLHQKKDVPEALDLIQRELGKQPYLAMQPITANVRSCGFGGVGIRTEQGEGGLIYVYLSTKDVLWVIDGQHRRFAMQMVFDYLRALTTSYRYPKRPALYATTGETVPTEELRVWLEIFEVARTLCTVMVEVHLGLNVEQERQLFHDLNNLTKKVEASLAFQFDQSNPVNLWIKEELLNTALLKAQIVDSDVTDWHDDKGYIARKDLIAVNAILFLNKTNVSGATPQDVEEKSQVARKFWEAVNEIEGFGEEGAKQKTVVAQPVVLKALAKLAYDLAFGKKTQNEKHLNMLLTGIPGLNFSHDEPMWRYYQLAPEERARWSLFGLTSYLPSEEGGNRDIGAYNRVMRFGSKHNDIVPILGDMIRWKLGLPNRHAESTSEAA